MDNKIRKSLIDKTTKEFYYNPQLVINENFKNIKSRILDNLKESDQIDIAISYVVWSGLSLIYDELKVFDNKSRILVTTEGFVTDPHSLKKLKELNLQVKVYNPSAKDTKGFHLKSYCFSKENHKTILVGSNNISIRAFGLSHEMMVEIDSKNEGYIVSEYSRMFEELWEDKSSEILTDELIENYAVLFYEKKRLEEAFYEFKLSNEKILPNYMQEKALLELNEARTEFNKGLVIAATGTGKTYLSAFDVRNVEAKKVLFLVHNRLILSDAIKSYKKIFPTKKILELESKNICLLDNYDFIFTTDKTAHSLLYNKVHRNYFDYIIYDEAHRIGEDTLYQELINYFSPKFTLGITATPERTKDPDYLYKVFEYSVPYEIRLLDALNNELICPFTYYGLNIERELLDENEQFDYFELAKYIKYQIGDKRHYGRKLKALLFANQIKEATLINEELNKLGFNSKLAVSGKSNQEQIEKYIESLKSNDLDSVEIICTVNKFNEGVDIPDINTIIMLRNTSSSIIYLQQLGRGLRRTSDSDKFVTVFDLIGNSNNNYSIAQVLTGNETADKRMLYHHVATSFETVSPFINVNIEEKAIEKIISSISSNFTVKTILNRKFKEELARYEFIPSLLELYKNPYLHELDLLQLLNKSFYDAFDSYYLKKYNIPTNNLLLRHFFRVIIQLVLRGYDDFELKEYADFLKGGILTSDKMIKILMPQEFKDGIPSAVLSNYNNKKHDFPKAFKKYNSGIIMNPIVIDKLKELNAYPLFLEHVELIEHLSMQKKYEMKTFDLVEKSEFLFKENSKDLYMNAVGEMIDHEQKKVFCTIKITKGESHYDNHIINKKRFVYHTQNSLTKERAERKISNWFKNNYEFKIAAKFPHLGYSNTSFFNLGKISVVDISKAIKNGERKYNHQITFELEEEFPQEFMMYDK